MQLKTNKLLFAFLLAILPKSVISDDKAGLIVNGIDTINTDVFWGFDFINSNACSLALYSSSTNCYSHIELNYYRSAAPAPYIGLSAPDQGYGIKQGKINLDSITTAPDDSVFKKQPWDRIDSIPPDSLAQYIGNVYVIKTGEDPRRGYPLFAKIKILDFAIRNLENHDIDMAFLWAANRTGYTDLATSNLDTFTLDYHVDTLTTSTALPHNTRQERNIRAALQTQSFIATAVNGRINLPAALLESGREFTVYDQRGRLLGRVKNTNANAHTEIRLPGGYCGVVVARF